MAKTRRFEELLCWQKARALANMVYDLTNHADFSADFKLRGQIQDAAGSVMHNIAEGNDAGTDAEFIRFLKIARRSCSEVQSQLYLALDRKYISDGELTKTYAAADEAKRIINGLIAYLRNSGSTSPSRGQIRESSPRYLTDRDLIVAPDTGNYQTNDY